MEKYTMFMDWKNQKKKKCAVNNASFCIVDTNGIGYFISNFLTIQKIVKNESKKRRERRRERGEVKK